VLQDVAEVRLVEALRRRLLLGHVLQEGVQDLQAWERERTTHNVNKMTQTPQAPKQEGKKADFCFCVQHKAMIC